MVIDESVIIVSVILSRDNAIQGKEESIIEELTKARKDSSGFHLEIKTQDMTCDTTCLLVCYEVTVLVRRLP